MAKRINDPGVMAATANAAVSFNLCWRLVEADGVLLATGYLSAPQDSHRGALLISSEPQKEQCDIIHYLRLISLQNS